jgi:hypothetical protein
MATSLSEIRQLMLRMEPTLGEVHNLASATVTTAVVTALATGKLTAGKYIDSFILRPDAATAADRLRICTNFTAASGTLTHAGTNYADTTATSEKLEIHMANPRLLDQAIDLTLAQTLHSDSVEMPALANSTRYWLNDFAWIKGPNDIKRIEGRSTPQISRNRYHDKWNAYSTSGVLTPDFLTLSGTGGSMARSTTQTWRSKYSLAITRVTNNVTVTEDIGLFETGVSADSLRGKIVTVAIAGWASAASQLRVGLNDGVTTTYSDYHTGGSTWEKLTKEVTIGASATKLDLIVEVNGSDGTGYVGERFAVLNSITDADWRDAYRPWGQEFIWNAEQSASLPVELPQMGRGRVYRIWTDRPYPQLDPTRLDAGTADDDVIDAPKELIATGALAHLYDDLAAANNQDTQRYQQRAFYWRSQFVPMQRLHLFRDGTEHGARPLLGRNLTAPTRVMRYR